MLIPQSATKTDVGTGYYVWVVKDGKTIKKDIVVNENYENNWIVDKSGQKVKTKAYKPDSIEKKEDKK